MSIEEEFAIRSEKACTPEQHEIAAKYHSAQVDSIQAKNQGRFGGPEEEEHSKAETMHTQAASALRDKGTDSGEAKDFSSAARMQSKTAHRTSASMSE